MGLKKIFPAIVVSFLLLTGCQWDNNNNDDMNRNDDTPIDETRTSRNDRNDLTQNVQNRNRFSVNDDKNDRNNRYEVSEEAAERIVQEIDEIDQAYVLTTENTAYVAATLDRKGDNNNNANNFPRNQRNDGMEIDNRITGDRDDDRGFDRNRTNRQNTATNVRNESSNDELTDEVKQKIEKIVKEVDRDIDNVYVSTSPDVFSLTDEYVSDFQNGRPVEGFFDQIGNMIERIFPENQRNNR